MGNKKVNVIVKTKEKDCMNL